MASVFRIDAVSCCVLIAFGLSAACNRSEPTSGNGSAARPPAQSPLEYAPRSPGDGSGKLFRELLPAETGIDFQIVWDKPAQYDGIFFSQNSGGGVTVGDYDQDGRPDVYLTRPSQGNRLFRNLGACRFADVTEQAGLRDDNFWGTGASFVDIDNDGDLDLYACSYGQPNRLYLNDGQGRFRQVDDGFGLNFRGASVMMCFADYDVDGDLDGYLVTAGLPPGKEHQFRVKFIDGKPYVLDELKEYWQLLYMPGERVRQVEAGQFDHLFRNDGPDAEGKLRFTDVTKQAGIDGPDIGQAAVWWDYDQDGYPDLYVANDYWGPDHLYRNQGDGTFRDVAPEVLVHTPWSSMGVDIVDINQDGRIDLMATDMAGSNHFRQKVGMGDMGKSGWFLEYGQPRQYSRNAVYLNSGMDRFMEVAYLTGLDSSDWTWTPRFEDLDNDGWVDAFITNGMSREFTNSDLNAKATQVAKEGTPEFFRFWREQDYRRDQNLMFRNLGDLRFEDVSARWGFDRVGVSFGAATADFDGDGDLDLLVNNMDVPACLYRNEGVTGNSLRLRLEGSQSNRQALGATVRLRQKDAEQIRYLTAARGWTSTSEPIVHFGVGAATIVEEVTIRWPSGQEQTLHNLTADRVHHVVEPAEQPTATTTASVSTNATSDGRSARKPKPTWFQPAEAILQQQLRHEETPFADYQRQPLLPHKMSQLGPGLATTDWNGDGRDDFFVGGAAGQSGRLLLSDPSGYRIVTPPALEADRACEDLGALFFDADQDGDDDLYVVSGGGEWEPNAPELQDRLYRNDHGELVADVNGLPNVRASGSVVAAADYDRDGDLDLFVGGRVVPGEYPLPADSFLLRNEGGRFVDASDEGLGPARRLGMVTSALWSDVDGDGWIDLLVTYEWGPVRLFRNRFPQRQQAVTAADELPDTIPPVLVDATAEAGLAERLGWWNGIAAADLDADGDIDFAVTNFGLNTKYHASAEHPASIYYGDFDGSGRAQIVEAEYENDKLFPVRGKSCSTNAMPFLAERYTTYTDFGLAQLQDIYTEEKLKQAHRVDVTELQSGVLLNDGTGRFEFRPLPRLAQLAPGFGVECLDFNGDGNLDLYLVQNFYSPQRETGYMDGGVSLILLGDGAGNFAPVWPDVSGLVVGGDAKSLITTDLNQDGLPDLLIAQNNGPLVGFVANPEHTPPMRRLWLEPADNIAAAKAIGARVIVRWNASHSPLYELQAGSGYLSQSATRVLATIPADCSRAELEIHWADGSETTQSLDIPPDVPVVRASFGR